jgi:hypothetical protein
MPKRPFVGSTAVSKRVISSLDRRAARAISIYLCYFLIGVLPGAHWLLEPMGWVWLAVDSGRSLDPYAGVEMSLNDGTPIAQRFVATAWELGAA